MTQVSVFVVSSVLISGGSDYAMITYYLVFSADPFLKKYAKKIKVDIENPLAKILRITVEMRAPNVKDKIFYVHF